MKRIEKNHWFVNNNQLSISLMNFYVSITFNQNKDTYFVLDVIDSDMNHLYFYFNTLEKAINFTEEIVAHSKTNVDVINLYNEKYNSKNEKKLVR